MGRTLLPALGAPRRDDDQAVLGHWSIVLPTDAVRIDLGMRPGVRRSVAREVRALPVGTTVAVWTAGPLARSRCRRLAARAGLALRRQYVLLPSANAATFVVEDAPAALSWFTHCILATPPGIATLAGPSEIAIRLVRRRPAGRLVGALAPGRLAVGRRS